MDLRSGQPFWIAKNGLLSTYPPLERDETCDVVVIGGGITGALTAHCLTDDGVNVVLLDRRDVASGSTAASTSLLQHEIDTELVELAKRIGESSAVRAYRTGLEAVDEIERLVAELGDSCGFARRQSLYLASRKAHVKQLQQEYELRRATGFDVSWLSSSDIEARFPFSASAGILSSGDAEIDAFQFTNRLLQSAARKGLRVYDRTTAEKWGPSDDGFRIQTDRGASVTARRIAFATGYESEKYLSRKVGTLKSTYAVVSEPMAPYPRWPERTLIWESARPYFYLRTTPDDRVIMGGEDTAFAEDHKRDRRIAKKAKRLIDRFEAMFPGTRYEVAYAWAGTFGETGDGLAYIGTPRDQPGTYFALGYGGNGITMSVTAARIIADLHAGRANPDASLFGFDR
jgi:glycine/D-amino acid oxidase-like deaminating enzyme